MVLRPLLLLTRPKPASEAFLSALPQDIRETVEILINPLVSIHVTGPIPDLTGVRGLIFTSANALHAYDVLNGDAGLVPAIAVGEGTAQAARALGFETDVAGGNADRLVNHVVNSGYEGPLVHLRGQVSVGNVAGRLTKAGVPTRDAILYEQRLEPLSQEARGAMSQDRTVIAPLFSPRTARQFMRESQGLGPVQIAAISAAVADEVPDHARARCRIADTPDRASMVRLVSDMIAEAAALERPRQGL